MELAALKESLRRLAPGAVPLPSEAPARLPTGYPRLDVLLGGGIPKGSITELVGDASSGKTSLALTMAAARTREHELVGYLDARGELYPPAAAAVGVELSHLLMVSFAHTEHRELDTHIARAADILIRSRHVPLVILDLAEPLSPKRSARLRQSAHATGTAIVVLGTTTSMVTGASLRLQAWSHRSGYGQARHLEVHTGKGAIRVGDKARIDLDRVRVDHAPARPLAESCERTAPGTPPPKPARARTEQQRHDANLSTARKRREHARHRIDIRQMEAF